MIHNELLVEIDIQLRHLPSYFNAGDKTIAGMKALRAVVELHKPEESGGPARCRVDGSHYPCPTIKAIEKELR